MAKVIYFLKIWMFKKQINITAKEEKNIRYICCFTITNYIKYWITAASPYSASRNDLNLLKSLSVYRKKNKELANAAINKIKNHLWYLSEELIAMAFFDDRITFETKRKMKEALPNHVESNPPKRQTINIDTFESRQLEDFVTKNTKIFFNIMWLDHTS